MLTKFLTYINRTDHFLLANSSGVDSMVLFDLLLKAKVKFSVAHCNFNLRVPDAMDDQLFLEQVCKTHAIPFYTKEFKTTEFSLNNGISTQMAARELRYAWFKELEEEHKFSYLLTAHHLNDSLETLYFNLIKGTGPAGLQGIRFKNGTTLRPLITIPKEEILAYAKDNNLAWREDSSNASLKYHRNKIRNEVFPIFKDINPNFEKTGKRNLERLKSLVESWSATFESLKSEVVSNDDTEVNLKLLKQKPGNLLFLEEFLKPFGFTFSQVKNVLEFSGTEAKEFLTETHVLNLKNEIAYLNEKGVENAFKKIEVSELEPAVFTTSLGQIRLESTQVFPSLPALRIKSTSYLDIDHLKLPLLIRKWEQGDRFQPFGMKGHKLVSDFMIDIGFSPLEKENQLVLISENKIVALLGQRTAQAASLSSSTKNILKISLI